MRVLDAYCPHLGAHLGVNSKVVDNTVQCPFHEWRFDGAGTCTHIPYSKNIPGKARVGSCPVREVNGQILVYFDRDKRPPAFEVPPMPGFGAKGWQRPTFHSVNVRTHVQEMNENIFDFAHFVYIHHFAALPEADIRFDGAHVVVGLQGSASLMGMTFPTTTDNYMHGAGCTVIHVKTPIEFVVIVAKTPIDETTVQHRYAICVKKKNLAADAFLRAYITRQVVADVLTDSAVWDNKVHVAKPLLVKGEGPIHTFRKWHEQFYFEADLAACRREFA